MKRLTFLILLASLVFALGAVADDFYDYQTVKTDGDAQYSSKNDLITVYVSSADTAYQDTVVSSMIDVRDMPDGGVVKILGWLDTYTPCDSAKDSAEVFTEVWTCLYDGDTDDHVKRLVIDTNSAGASGDLYTVTFIKDSLFNFIFIRTIFNDSVTTNIAAIDSNVMKMQYGVIVQD